jgi:15-cis-phytoene desaturase
VRAIASDVVIVGGGVAGLACGVALTENSVRAIVLEREVRLGGRATSWIDRATGDTVDIGPHVVHSEYRNFLALLDRLGTRHLITWQPEPFITLATKPRPLELRHSLLPAPLTLLPSFLRAHELSARDNLSNTRATWRALTFCEEQVPALDALNALDFLRGCGVSTRMIDFFWRFAAMVILNVPLEICSAAALMRVHSQLIGHGSLHFGFPAVGLADLYVEQATRAIEAGGGHVLPGARVCAIERGADVHTAVLEDGRRVSGRFCVCALPPRETTELAPEVSQARAFEPSPYISTYVWFDRKITAERFWAHLWSPSRLNYDFYDLSNIRPAWAGRASVIAANLIYSHRAQGMSDEEIVAATVREIAEFAPLAASASVRHAAVHRIPMAIACPKRGTETKRPGTRTAAERVFLAGDWLRTGLPSSMESAARSGFLAAEAILADLGRGRAIALAPSANEGFAGLVRRFSSDPLYAG